MQTKCNQIRCLCLALSILLKTFPECGAAESKPWAPGSQRTGAQTWRDGRQHEPFLQGSGSCPCTGVYLHWVPCQAQAYKLCFAYLNNRNFQTLLKDVHLSLLYILGAAEVVKTSLQKMSVLNLEQCVSTCVLRGGSKRIGLNLLIESILLNRERRVKTDLFGQISLSVNLNN